MANSLQTTLTLSYELFGERKHVHCRKAWKPEDKMHVLLEMSQLKVVRDKPRFHWRIVTNSMINSSSRCSSSLRDWFLQPWHPCRQGQTLPCFALHLLHFRTCYGKKLQASDDNLYQSPTATGQNKSCFLQLLLQTKKPCRQKRGAAIEGSCETVLLKEEKEHLHLSKTVQNWKVLLYSSTSFNI